MKLINFVNKFIDQPFGCSISAMPARIAGNLSRRKGSYIMKTKIINIKLPRRIDRGDEESFPTFNEIKQYYEGTLWEYVRKSDAPKMLVPFVIKYREYKPAYIGAAIQKTLSDSIKLADATCYRANNDIFYHEQMLKKHQQHLEQGQKWEALQKQVDDALGFHVRIATNWQTVGNDCFRFYNVEKLEKWIQSHNYAISACHKRKEKIQANREQLKQLLLQF